MDGSVARRVLTTLLRSRPGGFVSSFDPLAGSSTPSTSALATLITSRFTYVPSGDTY